MRQPNINLKERQALIKVDETIAQPGEMSATIELILRDPDGKIARHIGPKRSESYVQQFLQILYAMVRGQPETMPIMLLDVANLTYGSPIRYSTLSCVALTNIATRSIVVGTGNTAPTITDYQLQTQIAHGVGAGQLQYSATTFGTPAADATTSQFTITRNFTNGSGGAITVNEVGLYALMQANGAGAVPIDRYAMIIRDVIGGGISVLNGQTLTINYRPQTVI